MSPPNGVTSANRTIRVQVSNNTGGALSCEQARLDYGEWSSLPPDRIEPGRKAEFLVLSNGGGVEGTVKLGGVSLRFSNPLIGSNTFSCSSDQPQIRCSLSGGKGTDAVLDLSVTRSAGAATGRFSTLEVAVPGRASIGVNKARELMHNDRPQQPSLASLNPPLSKQDQLSLRQDVTKLETCTGNAARLQLKVNNISCNAALEQLMTMGQSSLMRRCPLGWTVLANPDINGASNSSILCHQTSTAAPDQRMVKAFVYALRH